MKNDKTDGCLDEAEEPITEKEVDPQETEIDVTRRQEIITENDPPPVNRLGKYPFSCKINDHMVAHSW